METGKRAEWLDVMRRPLARLRRAILAAICLVYMENQSSELDTVTHALLDATDADSDMTCFTEITAVLKVKHSRSALACSVGDRKQGADDGQLWPRSAAARAGRMVHCTCAQAVASLHTTTVSNRVLENDLLS